MFGKSLYLFSLSLFFAQITSKFCQLCSKKSFEIDGRNCQIKSVMSTERAPQILQERLTLQLEHLNEFCGHSQWNYLAPFFCCLKLLTHLQALDQRENVKKTKFKIIPTFLFLAILQSRVQSTRRKEFSKKFVEFGDAFLK